MAVGLEDIKKLRTMTGAGLGDCKKALTEANGDIEAAIEIIRKKGQAVAAKRSDREAAEGCVLCKYENGFAAIIALKCVTCSAPWFRPTSLLKNRLTTSPCR